MKKIPWEVRLGVGLMLGAVVFHYIHYLIFRDWHHVFIYLLGDIAFLPVEVLFVILIIERLLARREKKMVMEKLNMVIDTFFAQIGTRLLRLLTIFDPDLPARQEHLNIQNSWGKSDYREAFHYVESLPVNLLLDKNNRTRLPELRQFLVKERDFLVRLLENPILLEQETFTELLWAVFHLGDELSWRISLENLPEPDYEHLAGDLTRAYRLMLREWLSFMQNLQSSYPFLFSLAVRTNPYSQNNQVVISDSGKIGSK
ncbi:MAG: hypothetical protein NC911_09420 [Candidatus Omnitrophica bacterium]|nr:hypothetical protein [Candidatus Omnitrophota bacterium]